MKKFPYYLIAVLCLTLILNACKKDNLKPTPEPDPDKPPVGQQDDLVYPKKDMRAVWVTTAWGLDWPRGDYNMETQKQQYISYLNKFKELNINAIFFQVKPMGDAFYDSSYEPWSASITGTRGKDPGYDILKFLIDEAHARGIEFHAWMNPYRIATAQPYPALHPSIKPEWVLSLGSIQIYNPALPEVRQRLADIVKETITRYDVDGIHFDDYFYPSGENYNDQAYYQQYGSGYNTIQDFRRGNVDKAIEAVHNVIVATKPEVVFSVSPAPNRNTNYNNLYADVEKWNKEGWLDVVIPQLYQERGNKYNDFIANLQWWVQHNHGTPVMVGHGFYKFGDPTMPSAFQSSAELQEQFNITRSNAKIVGNAQYSARYLYLNKVGVTDKLKEIYKDPAVMPFLGRAVAPAPVAASNVKIESNKLKWSTSGNVQSVVYYFADLKKPAVVLEITDATELSITKKGHYSVATLNADNKESKPSAVVEKK